MTEPTDDERKALKWLDEIDLEDRAVKTWFLCIYSNRVWIGIRGWRWWGFSLSAPRVRRYVCL